MDLHIQMYNSGNFAYVADEEEEDTYMYACLNYCS